MPPRQNLALIAPGLAGLAAVVCFLGVLFGVPRLLDAGFGSGLSFWAPAVAVVVGGAVAVLTAVAAVASVVRPSAWTHAAAALAAGALAGFFAPDALQRFVFLVATSSASGVLALLWSLLGSTLAAAAALAALVRLAQLLAGVAEAPGGAGRGGAASTGPTGGWSATGDGAASGPRGWGSGSASPPGPAWGPGAES